MPDGPEIKLNVNTGSGTGAVNELTSSFDKLKTGVQGADTELADMIGQLKNLAQQIGVDRLAWDAFIIAIKSRADEGKVAVRELREALIDVSKMGGGKTWKDGDGGEEDLRAIRKTIDIYEELDNKVKAYIVSADLAAAAGRNINLGQWDIREQQLTGRYPLTASQSGAVGDAGMGLVSAQIEREAAENRRRQTQEMERQFNERGRMVSSAGSDVDKWRTGQQKGYDKSIVDGQIAAEREVSAAISESVRNRGIIEREVANQRKQDLETEIRLERELIALEDRAALAGKRGSARVEVLRGQALRGEEDPARRSRIGAAFDTMAEAEEGGGGFSARMMRGVAQGAMGVGAGNYQMYYLMNSISNISSGSAMGAGIAAGGVSLLALAAAQVAAANGASQHVRELRNLSEEMGTTIKGARELSGMAAITGVPIDTINAGMRQLNMGITESGGRGIGANAVLNQIGVSPEINGQLKDTKQLLFDISDAIKGMSDTEARDILERLFGRGGRNMLPIMREDMRGLAAEVNNLSNGLDDEKALHYAEEMSKLGLIYDTLKQKFAEPLFLVMDLVDGSGSTSEIDRLLKAIADKQGGAKPQDFSKKNYTLNDLVNIGGSQEREKYIASRSNTLEGLQQKLRIDEEEYKRLDSAATTAPGKGEVRSDKQQATMNTAAGRALSTVEADKAAIKAMEDKGQALISIQRLTDRASETEVSGYQKIDRELKDHIQLLGDQLRLHEITQSQLDAQTTAYQRLAAAERSAYDVRAGKSSLKDLAASDRTLGLGEISNERSMAASTLALRRVQARYSIPTNSSIYADYQFGMDEAKAKRSSAMLSLGGEYDEMQEARGSGDTIRANSLQSQINTRKSEINSTYEVDKQKLINDLLGARTKLINDAADAQSKYNSILGEIRTSSIESTTKFQESQLKNRLSNSMQIMRARARGQGAGGQGVMANNEFSYAMQMAGIGVNEAQSGYTEAMANESMRSSDVMSKSGLTSDEMWAEKAKHAQNDYQIQQRLQSELGEQLKAIDDAHTERQKTSIELMQQQNEQVKAFAGDLLGAYMQAMLHRQSGSFPVREALGQQFLGWGKKVGENIVGAGFGMLQHGGVGQHDIIPGLSRTVTDPKTGQTHDELTTLGKIFQGTPLGHRPTGGDKYVVSIDTTTQKILALMQNVYGQDGNGGGSMPGLGQGDYDVSGGSPLPLGLPLSSGSESGAIINSIVSGGKSSGGGIGGMLNGITGGVFGKLFSSGPSNIPLSWNSPLGSGSENGSIINSIPGSDGSGGVTMSVDSEGNPVYSINANSSASGSSGRNGQFGTINTGTAGSTIEGVANTATTAIKDVSAVANAASNIKNSDKNTGKSGAGAVSYDISQGLQAAATVANSIPGGQVVGSALEIGALVAAGVSAIFGDQRKDRALQMQYDAEQHQWTAPSAYGLVTSQNGMSVTGDLTGAPRQYNGPLLAYPNTSSYTSAYDYTVNRVGPQIAPPSGVTWPGGGGMSVPGGVGTLGNTILSLYIQAMDNKSIMDNAAGIASAVHAAINDGHPIRNGIQAAANPR